MLSHGEFRVKQETKILYFLCELDVANAKRDGGWKWVSKAKWGFNLIEKMLFFLSFSKTQWLHSGRPWSNWLSQVYMTIAQSDDLDLHSWSQVHLELDYFLTCNILDYIYTITFKLGMTVDLWVPYMLMLVSITLTLMQGRSGSAMAKIQRWIISTTKQATSINLATTVGHCFTWLWLCKRLYGLTSFSVITPEGGCFC